MQRRRVACAGCCWLVMVWLSPAAAITAAVDVTHPAGRGLQQQLPPLPKFFVSRVATSLTNTYSWTIDRAASASGVVVKADGISRQQIGYTLNFQKQLDSIIYKIDGQIDVTNVSPVTQLTIKSATLFIAGSSFTPACRSMPAAPYVMTPAEVVSCPFSITLPANAGLVNNAGSISGYVDTNIGRRALDSPVPFSFAACVPMRIPTERAAVVPTPAPAPAGMTGSVGTGGCTTLEIGGCVTITDGSYITMKYKDDKGTAAAGNISIPRSQLFGVAQISNSVQGAPRIEPVLPNAVAVSNQAVSDGQGMMPQMPDASWWGGRRRLLLLLESSDGSIGSIGSFFRGVLSKRRRPDQQQPQQQEHDEAVQGVAWGSKRRGFPPSRRLQQQQQQQLSLNAGAAKSVVWPYPQVTGLRPPLGLAGVPSRPADKPEKICVSKSYPFSMVWGPLMPQACGTYEVQNTAAAAYVDNSRPPVTVTSYIYLQVICPAAAKP